MPGNSHVGRSGELQLAPGADFSKRLEAILAEADTERRRVMWVQRIRRLLPLVLLVGPLLGWRLMVATGTGSHVVVHALAWLTFLLDVGVHIDTAVLSYLGLRALPSVVGGLLFLLLTWSLLGDGSPPVQPEVEGRRSVPPPTVRTETRDDRGDVA
jgi:hypothetical protein